VDRVLSISAFIARICASARSIFRINAKARQRTLVSILILTTGVLPGSTAWAEAQIPYSTTGDFLILNSGWAPQIAEAARLLIGPQVSEALLRHWSVSLLRRGLVTHSPLDRPQAAVALMEVGDPAGVLATTEIVRHGDYLSRMVAVQRLAESGSTGAGFLAAQCAEQNGFARLMLGSFIRFDDRSLFACLVPALHSDQLETRLLANIALSHMGDASSIPRMRLLWRRVVDPAERGELAGALFASGDTSLLAQVRHDLACGKTVDDRRFAALALGQLNDSAVRAELAAALDDSAIAVRLAAAAALSRLGDARALDLLARAVDDRGGYPHWLLENYMERIDVHAAWGLLLRMAHSPDSDLRIAAVQAIASRRDPLSERTLLELLDSERDWSVRTSIVWGLAETGSRRAIAPLTALLSDDCPSVRWEAAICLLRLLSAPHAAG
jgi:HEAT repeat protein